MAAGSQHKGEGMSPTSPRLCVIELGTWLAAPGAAALLGDLPADIIKIETRSGDPGRNYITALGGSKTSPSFALLNRAKRSISLDLQDPTDRNLLEDMLARADVFITNMRSTSLERLGLDPETIMGRYPRLIFASITGLGLRGPERDVPVYDVGGFWARSGLISQISMPGSTPPSPTGGYGDITTALAAYAGIVSALLKREWTGQGALVETSLLQTGAYVMGGDLAVQAEHGHVHSQRVREECRTPLVNSYATSDGRWFYLTAIEAGRHFPSLCRAIDRPEIAADPRFKDSQAIRQKRLELIALLDDIFARQPLSFWADRFNEQKVPWQAIVSPAEVLEDPQLKANGMVRPVRDGSKCWGMVTSPFLISRSSAEEVQAPSLDEHGVEIRAVFERRAERTNCD